MVFVFCAVRDPDSSRWYCFNDRSVSESDVTDVEATFGGSLVAYYLLYRKKDGQEKHFLPLEKYPSINHLVRPRMFGCIRCGYCVVNDLVDVNVVTFLEDVCVMENIRMTRGVEYCC